jgi:hypothetical protein
MKGGTEMGIIFGLLFTGVGLYVLIRGFTEFRTSKASRDWPSVEGQVTVAMVGTKVGHSSSQGRSRKYSPQVAYTYSILGQQYTSNQVIIGARQWYASRAKAEALLTYQPGQQVTVYYNPDNPAQAILEVGATRGTWGTLTIGAVFTILGTIVLIISASGMFAG